MNGFSVYILDQSQKTSLLAPPISDVAVPSTSTTSSGEHGGKLSEAQVRVDEMREEFMVALDHNMQEMNARLRKLRSEIGHLHDNPCKRLDVAHRRLMAEADHYLDVHNMCKKRVKSKKLTQELMSMLREHQIHAFHGLCAAFDYVYEVHAQVEAAR